jgi:tight adherence protein C
MMMLEQLTGVSPEILITAAAGLIAFITIVFVWQALVQRDPLTSRAKSLGRHRDTLKADMMKANANRFQRVETMTFMRKVTERLNLLKGEHVKKTSQNLMRAGWRSKDAVVIFLFLRFILPFVLGGMTALIVYGFGVLEGPPTVKILAVMIAAVVGIYLPSVVVANVVAKRRVQLQRGLPDSLDLLVICAESGLALDAALTRVSREMVRSAPELADELSMTAVELGFQPNRRTALDNFLKRTDLPSIRGVVNTLMQTEKYGTPLAQSLRVLASEYRDERMLMAEEKAAKLPATLTIPLIVFILPTLFIVLLGPAIISAIDGLGGL